MGVSLSSSFFPPPNKPPNHELEPESEAESGIGLELDEICCDGIWPGNWFIGRGGFFIYKLIEHDHVLIELKYRSPAASGGSHR
ncbi:hypothetical protein SAY87_029174 [Trapa incisa]|uniref:Uncharacterized protein n=1 Tax=Trapa incisa TaxID=236973 RepID=A0AAN7QSQ9_9MYRT|nr:hypothetical protein SAY87_029174 [Trapa incisa]